MNTITVCVGSACHLKGAYDIIEIFQKLITDNSLEDTVTLKGSYCLGKCSKDVSVKADESGVISVTPGSAEAFFKKYVLGE